MGKWMKYAGRLGFGKQRGETPPDRQLAISGYRVWYQLRRGGSTYVSAAYTRRAAKKMRQMCRLSGHKGAMSVLFPAVAHERRGQVAGYRLGVVRRIVGTECQWEPLGRVEPLSTAAAAVEGMRRASPGLDVRLFPVSWDAYFSLN